MVGVSSVLDVKSAEIGSVLVEDHEGRRSLQKIGLGELIYLELLRDSTVIGKNYFVKVVLSKL